MKSRVTFTSMENGSLEDFELIRNNDNDFARSLASRIIRHLRSFSEDDGAYQINRLEHCLQTATRAMRDGADDEWIVAALLHDIGDILAPYSHAEASYAIVKYYLREEVSWVVRHHAIFQKYHNKSLSKEERCEREIYKESPYYQSAIKFCDQWDQKSFDPGYINEPLETFIPIVEMIFAFPKYNKNNKI